MADDPIPGRTEEPPLATWQMPPPSTREPVAEAKREELPWVGKRKAKAKRRR